MHKCRKQCAVCVQISYLFVQAISPWNRTQNKYFAFSKLCNNKASWGFTTIFMSKLQQKQKKTMPCLLKKQSLKAVVDIYKQKDAHWCRDLCSLFITRDEEDSSMAIVLFVYIGLATLLSPVHGLHGSGLLQHHTSDHHDYGSLTCPSWFVPQEANGTTQRGCTVVTH